MPVSFKRSITGYIAQAIVMDGFVSFIPSRKLSHVNPLRQRIRDMISVRISMVLSTAKAMICMGGIQGLFATMCRPVFVSAFFASQLLALLRSSE